MKIATLPSLTLMSPTGFVHDKRSEGWELIMQGPQVQEGKTILDFYSFLRDDETYVNGDIFLVRALDMEGAEASQHHLERLLAQADNIPAEFRPFYLVATGTKWRLRDRRSYVPSLLWRGGGWAMDFVRVWFDSRVGRQTLVVRVRK